MSNQPQRFRKKPVVIEAMQFTSGFAMRAADWCHAEVFLVSDKPPSSVYELRIFTLEGWMTAKDGDWIIKGVQGEFYPCKPDIFALTYEPARPECGCYLCWEGWAHSFNPPKHLDRMLTCDECGNKRCPHATDHNNPCTRSNDPGQEGSRYGEVSS